MYDVINNCGHVSGNARNYSGYRHIALVERLDGHNQTRIQNTTHIRVIEDYTLYVGETTKSKGYRILQSFYHRADEWNQEAAAIAKQRGEYTQHRELVSTALLTLAQESLS